MSVKFKLDVFNRDASEKIDKMLTFKSVDNTALFRKNNFSTTDYGITVKMYYSEEGLVYLPYRFACSLFKKTLNIDNKYPIIFDDKKDKFSGKLLSRQEEPFKEAVNYLAKFNTVTIALYPGFGKTFLGTMLSWYINLKTCVLVHRENVGKQWITTFKKYFKIDEKLICFVDKKINLEAKVFVCMDGRTDYIPKEIKEQIGCLIIDEAHCFCAPSKVKPMLSFSPKYVIAETATPIKDNGMHTMIQSICGTHYIKKMSSKPFKFYIINTKLDFETDSDKNPFGDLLTQQCDSGERNKIILDILENNQKYKTIVVSSRKHHCNFLHQQLAEKGLESSELYGTKKNYKTSNILIGTGSKMGVGFDEANFCDDYDGVPSELLLILYTFASWAPFEQVRGRGMRSENPKVIMFKDEHNITKKHFRNIKKWVKESNGEIIEIKKLDDFKI